MEKLNNRDLDHILQSSTDKFHVFLSYFRKIKIPLISHEVDPTGIIYRARHSLPEEVMEVFEDYSYPPPTDSFSRIGKPGDVWFYASEDYDACLSELLPTWESDKGQQLRVTFGYWKIAETLKVLLIPDMENKNRTANLIEAKAQLSDEDLKFWKLIYPYFFQSIEENPHIYQLTAALVTAMSEEAQKKKIPLDGIVYPCVENKEKTNLAIKPHVIDQNKIIFESASDMLFQEEKGGNGIYEGFSGPHDKRKGFFISDSKKIIWEDQ